MFLRFLALFLLAFLASSSKYAFAWGERGHDLIARVAARLVVERSPRGDEFAAVFEQKEHMLGHLANIPDIMWRNGDSQAQALNAPTHFVDTEFFALSPAYANAPSTIAALEAQVSALCGQAPSGYVCPMEKGAQKVDAATIGTAPFRVRQLFDRMVVALSEAKVATTPKAMMAATDEALLDAGIMAHFVGDLGNPWHGTRDYDGWESGQGGIHKYFEEELVNALPLSLDEDVISEALRGKPFQRVTQQMPAAQRANLRTNPLAVAWALTFDSLAHLDEVRALDRKVALRKPSSAERGLKLKAERRDPRDVRGDFRIILTERLATAADTLAALWLAAYEKAGKPSLKGYRSFTYPLAPAFITPNY